MNATDLLSTEFGALATTLVVAYAITIALVASLTLARAYHVIKEHV